VIDLEPFVPDLFVERGQLYDREGRTDLAIQDYQRYVEMGGSRSNKPVLWVSRRIFHLRLESDLKPEKYRTRRWFVP
jgi:hypothetical protein